MPDLITFHVIRVVANNQERKLYYLSSTDAYEAASYLTEQAFAKGISWEVFVGTENLYGSTQVSPFPPPPVIQGVNPSGLTSYQGPPGSVGPGVNQIGSGPGSTAQSASADKAAGAPRVFQQLQPGMSLLTQQQALALLPPYMRNSVNNSETLPQQQIPAPFTGSTHP